MREMRFYCEDARHASIKKILAILGMLPGAFLIFVAILKGMGERNDFVRMCTKLAWPIGIVAVALIGGAIFTYYKFRCSFVLTVLPQGGMQAVIRDHDGIEHGATGRWSFHALYTKHYYKYGTYRKQLYLILFCNDKMYCMLRHEVAAAFPPPDGFREIGSEPSLEAHIPVYFTNKTPEVHGLVRQQLMEATAIQMRQ